MHLNEHTLDKPLCWEVDSRPGKFLACDYIVQSSRLLELTLDGDASFSVLACEQILGSTLETLHPDDSPALEDICFKVYWPAES